MPVLDSIDYLPGRLLRNGHLNTIFPALFRQTQPLQYQRERILTPDDDFLDVDFMRSDHGKHGDHGRVAFLLHGLEGNSSSQYIKGTADIFFQNGWDVAMINHRSCSGEMNRQKRMYHSGVTDDPHTVIQRLKRDYSEIVMVGFSLGGNMTLKYLGEWSRQTDPAIKCAVAISVPIDLQSCSLRIISPSNFIYDKRFLRSLTKKVHLKHQQFPNTFKPELLKQVKNLWDFDEYYTAPLHGFDGAKGYYRDCSSLPGLKNIRIPTLLINAQDDPMLGKECYPYDIANDSEHLHFMAPEYGGHCGFTLFGKRNYWQELQIMEFVKKYT
ncbi:MAG: alpha/beta fold hydrolase [Bacteroidota bacterium]